MSKKKQKEERSMANRYPNIQTAKAKWCYPTPSQSLFANLNDQISALTKAKFAKTQHNNSTNISKILLHHIVWRQVYEFLWE